MTTPLSTRNAKHLEQIDESAQTKTAGGDATGATTSDRICHRLLRFANEPPTKMAAATVALPHSKNAATSAASGGEHRPLVDALQVEETLQRLLDDTKMRMGQDVDYESLPLREYFRSVFFKYTCAFIKFHRHHAQKCCCNRRGFACSHRAVQTDASDIIDIETLTDVANRIASDLADVQRELDLQVALVRTDMVSVRKLSVRDAPGCLRGRERREARDSLVRQRSNKLGDLNR